MIKGSLGGEIHGESEALRRHETELLASKSKHER